MVHPLLVSNSGDNQEEELTSTDYTLNIPQGLTSYVYSLLDETDGDVVADYGEILNDLDTTTKTTGTIKLTTSNKTYTGTFERENDNLVVDIRNSSLTLYLTYEETDDDATLTTSVEEAE